MQFLWHTLPAIAAQNTRACGVNLLNQPTGTSSLVGGYGYRNIPSSIGNGLRQILIAHHAANIQILKNDMIVSFYVVIGKLVREVSALVRHLLMRLCQLGSRLGAVFSAFLFTGKRTLDALQVSFFVAQMTRVFPCFAVRVNREVVQAEINANDLSGFWQKLFRHFITGEASEPFAGCRKANSDGFDLALNRAMQTKLESSNIFYREIFAIKAPPRLFERERIICLYILKAWIADFTAAFSHSAKEGLKRFVQSFDHILQDLTADLLEFWKCFFNFWQFIFLVNGRNLAMIAPHHAPVLKSTVVEIAAQSKPFDRVDMCLLVANCFIFEGLSHSLK